MQISELQGKWVAKYLTGEYALPSPAQMRADMEHQRQRTSKRLVSSARHTVQVEQFDLAWKLRRELHRGRRRAQHRRPALAGMNVLGPAGEAGETTLREA